MTDWLESLRVINASGTMTSLGSSSVSSNGAKAMTDVLPMFVRISDLQMEASKVIRQVIGAEAGCITSCAAAGIAICVAACICGDNLDCAEKLPNDTEPRNEVILQKGHSVWFSGSLPQMIRLAGADIVEIGHVTRAGTYQLEGAITDKTTAALYVVSHHTSQYGLIGLEEFVETAHKRDIPVIVDAASESDMPRFIKSGADLVCFSGHKFLQGPTSGIVAGRADLIHACLVHQLHGIGRAMKIGKEGIVGVIEALKQREHLDQETIQSAQTDIVNEYLKGLDGVIGIACEVVPDPTGNLISRVRVHVSPNESGLTAFQLSEELKRHCPPIFVRDDEIDLSYFELDPCNLTLEEAGTVSEAIAKILKRNVKEKQLIAQRFSMAPNLADQLWYGLQREAPVDGEERG